MTNSSTCSPYISDGHADGELYLSGEIYMPVTATQYSETIAKKVVEATRGSVLVKDIMGSIQKYQNAPSSTATFYKLYGKIRSETLAEMVGAVGKKVYDQALDGDFKSQEFYLRSKGGWSPNSTVNEVEQSEDPDTDDSAIDSLVALLGKSVDTNDCNCSPEDCNCR